MDHRAATWLNSLVVGHPAVVRIIKAVTWLGSGGVLWTLTGTAAVVLAIRRRWRLVIYLLVTGAGELTLDPVLKALVGRLRPVVAHPIAHGNGDSFPAGTRSASPGWALPPSPSNYPARLRAPR